jgi:glycosyltransferase involved in cell wall biosynthesis
VTEARGRDAVPRCLHLLPDTDDAGAENQARYLMKALRDSGAVQVELAYFARGNAHSAFEALEIPLHLVPKRRRLSLDLISRARRLRRAFAGRPPDILHTWLLEGNLVGLLAARGWPETRVVISQRASRNELDYPAILRVQRLLLGRADHAVSNSSGGAEVLAGMGLPRERISVIPNGIPADRVAVEADRDEVRSARGWDGADVVAWVGRAEDPKTVAQKDLPTLVAAIAELREHRATARLVLIGPSPAELQAQGITLPLWAETLGWWSRPADLLNAADLVVIASRFEGNSNVAGEALLLGLPVVTTDCGEHCGPVRRAGGRVVPVGDAAALANAAAELLGAPPERSVVRHAATEDLSVERMAAAHIDLYRALLGVRSR